MPSKGKTDPAVYELMVALRKLTRTTLLHQQAVAASVGLHATDAECIDFLQEMGPSTAGDLARATRLTTGAITNVIDRLEKAGFVERKPDADDRRKVIVSLLPQKHLPARQHYHHLAKNVEDLFTAYTPQELELLVSHTRALAQIYQEEIEGINKHDH